MSAEQKQRAEADRKKLAQLEDEAEKSTSFADHGVVVHELSSLG